MGFEAVGGRRERLARIKSLALDTLCSGLAASADPHPRNELLRVDARGGAIRFAYRLPEAEHRRLPRAPGLRERVQIAARELVLTRILYRPGGGGVLCAHEGHRDGAGPQAGEADPERRGVGAVRRGFDGLASPR